MPKKRHQWKYRREYTVSRKATPAICKRCGAKHWYKQRPKTQPCAGPSTEDLIYEARAGALLLVNPKPMPPCKA